MRTNHESKVFQLPAPSVVGQMAHRLFPDDPQEKGILEPELPETPQPEKPLLLTTKQAAVLLNCSVRTVGRMMFRGELVVRKIGSLTRIPRTSVEAFIRKGLKTRA